MLFPTEFVLSLDWAFCHDIIVDCTCRWLMYSVLEVTASMFLLLLLLAVVAVAVAAVSFLLLFQHLSMILPVVVAQTRKYN